MSLFYLKGLPLNQRRVLEMPRNRTAACGVVQYIPCLHFVFHIFAYVYFVFRSQEGLNRVGCSEWITLIRSGGRDRTL